MMAIEDPTDGLAELTAGLERFCVDVFGLRVLAREHDRVWCAAGPTRGWACGHRAGRSSGTATAGTSTSRSPPQPEASTACATSSTRDGELARLGHYRRSWV